jgi:hypothetical protein
MQIFYLYSLSTDITQQIHTVAVTVVIDFKQYFIRDM